MTKLKTGTAYAKQPEIYVCEGCGETRDMYLWKAPYQVIRARGNPVSIKPLCSAACLVKWAKGEPQ